MTDIHPLREASGERIPKEQNGALKEPQLLSASVVEDLEKGIP